MFGREAAYALVGAWRLARLDPGGMAYFDRSLAGALRSFRAAILVYPLFLLLLAIRLRPEQWDRAGPLRVVVVETIGYVLAWTVFPLATLQLARLIGREAQWPGFIAAYNWAQVLTTTAILFCAALATSGGLGGLGRVLPALAVLLALAYGGYIAYVALQTTPQVAAGIVALDVAISLIVSGVTDALL
jgi:pimeloyl-ACP methyl ester carboxylesterase